MKGKKLLSLVLSIAMTLSMFSGLTMTSAQAAVGDAANNVWTASEADAGKTADTVLADDEKGTLTTLFDLTYADTLTDSEGVTTPISETVGDRTFTAYVTHPSMNGGFNNDGTIRTGYTTLFSYVPKADGVLTAYFMDVASSKKVCIVEDGAQNFKTGGSIVYTSGIDESMSVSAQLSAGKTYYFFVDGSKGRFMAVDYEVGAAYEQATPAPATAAPTLDPNAKIYEWEVSEADVNKKAGDLLMTGLSLVSDNAGTNKYVTAADNGDLVGGVATGSALKFVAPENGTISVTFKDLGNADNFKTAHIYDATAGKEVASYTTKGEGKETFDLSVGVTEGSTYYIYANGTRARYSAAKFTAGEAPKDYSWTVSASDIGKTAGTALMEGLTLVADNSSESEKYVTAAENGKIQKDDEGVASVTGAALKFVAPEDGKLEVTMIDVGSENEDGSIKVVNPVIYNYETGKDVFSYENTAAKETVVLTAQVETGKTYYAIATGTKGRFSSAKFTPTSGAEETQAPATDAPVNTDAPAVNAIAYADGTVAVTLADVQTAVLIKSTYADGVLSGVTSYDLTFTNGVATQALEAAEGTKLMVWDSLKGMKPLCASYTVSAKVDETDAPNETDVPKETTTPTETPSNLPKDVIFRADDTAFDNMFNLSEAATASNGLTVSAGIGSNNKKVAYTHNGTNYTFTRQWKHGNNTQTLTFTPATSCVVTVVFNGNGGVDRMVNISQNGTVLAQGFSTDTANTAAETVVADILDATAGDVVISGGGSNKNISAIFVEYYDATPDKAVTGTITNSTGEDLTAETIVFTNKADATDVVEMAYAENYSVNLTKGATYTISVKGKESTICPTISTAEITVTKNRNELTHNFELVKIGEVTVTGNVYTLSSHDLRTPAKAYDSTIGASLNFTKDGDTTPTTATVNADGTYSVSLLSNESYTVALANAEGYTLSALSTSYELLGGVENPKKNVLLMKDTADSVEYKETVTVGADKDYQTVSDAVAAIRKMSRTNERVTIVVDSGVYTEQVYLDVNNVTLKSADETNPALISWYYGIGYEYYSAAKDGWYNADAAVAQTAKGTAQKWGGTVYVKGTNFLAENIKFQSTFNLEIVAQELADGVASGGGDAKTYDRTAKDADPKSRAAVERAAAMLVEGANAEFYKCSFQSSQDTLWTGSSAAYFKECDIYGGTDYIFGGNSVVFDTCNLIWQGYSDQQAGGHITACKNSSTEDNGYLMLNCTVKNNTADSGQQFAQGSYGRNWGGANCKVIFLNTKLEGDAKVAKWVKMSGELAQSNLYVVNTIGADGNPVTLTSEDQPCGTLSAEEIAAIDPYDYFNGWTPVHYVGEDPVIPTATPTVAPTATPTVAPTATPTVAPTVTPTATPTPTPAPDFVANSKVVDGYSVAQTTAEGETVYTFTKTAGVGVDGAGYSFDISDLLGENKYSDKGTMTVSMQFMMPNAANKPAGDGYIDISSSTNYSGTDATRFVRYNIYNGWDQFNYFGAGDTRTNGGLKFSNYEGQWYTLTATIDLTSKSTSVVTKVGSDSATYGPLATFPSAPVDGKLYINVIPTRYSPDNNAIGFSIKNIKVDYEEAPDVIPANITAVNGTDDLKTTKLGGEVAVDKATASVGDKVTVTPTAYYGFEVSAVNVEKITESSRETVTITANDGIYGFDVEDGVTDYNVSVIFAQKANTKVLYFADSTINNIPRIAMDKDLKVMNYVKAGAAATWTAQDFKVNGNAPTGMKVVLTKNNDPAVTVSLNGTDVGTAQALTFENEFKAAKTSYFTADVALTGATFTDSDALGISISSPSGSTGYLGNYWYVVLEYNNSATE